MACVLVELTGVAIASLSVAASRLVLVERKFAGLADWRQLKIQYCPILLYKCALFYVHRIKHKGY